MPLEHEKKHIVIFNSVFPDTGKDEKKNIFFFQVAIVFILAIRTQGRLNIVSLHCKLPFKDHYVLGRVLGFHCVSVAFSSF